MGSNLTAAENLAQTICQMARKAHSPQYSQWISDSEAAELWGITDRELREIRRSLEELG